MSKPGGRRILSDDFVVVVNGVQFNPHEGEWIDVMPVQSVADLRQRIKLAQMQVELDALQGEPDAERKQIAILDANLPPLCEMLGRVILGWNWTDLAGKLLPNPHNEPGVMEQLVTTDELLYLIAITQPEVPAERKNGSRPSRTTSSATPPQMTRQSARDRSHTKR